MIIINIHSFLSLFLYFFFSLVNQKRFAQFGSRNKLQILEERANFEEDNPKAQADYLRVS
jgi:hypothetical protein